MEKVYCLLLGIRAFERGYIVPRPGRIYKITAHLNRCSSTKFVVVRWACRQTEVKFPAKNFFFGLHVIFRIQRIQLNLERMERFQIKWQTLRFSVGSHSRLKKRGIHIFPAWCWELKGTVWSLHRMWWASGSLIRKPKDPFVVFWAKHLGK